MTWTLAEAKDQLSQVVRRAVDEGPQTISVRGRETAVVIGKAEYDRLRPNAAPRDFKTYLLSIPSLDGVDLNRDTAPAPDIEL
jgi:prevent-host-death family protein